MTVRFVSPDEGIPFGPTHGPRSAFVAVVDFSARQHHVSIAAVQLMLTVPDGSDSGDREAGSISDRCEAALTDAIATFGQAKRYWQRLHQHHWVLPFDRLGSLLSFLEANEDLTRAQADRAVLFGSVSWRGYLRDVNYAPTDAELSPLDSWRSAESSWTLELTSAPGLVCDFVLGRDARDPSWKSTFRQIRLSLPIRFDPKHLRHVVEAKTPQGFRVRDISLDAPTPPSD